MYTNIEIINPLKNVIIIFFLGSPGNLPGGTIFSYNHLKSPLLSYETLNSIIMAAIKADINALIRNPLNITIPI